MGGRHSFHCYPMCQLALCKKCRNCGFGLRSYRIFGLQHRSLFTYKSTDVPRAIHSAYATIPQPIAPITTDLGYQTNLGNSCDKRKGEESVEPQEHPIETGYLQCSVITLCVSLPPAVSEFVILCFRTCRRWRIN